MVFFSHPTDSEPRFESEALSVGLSIRYLNEQFKILEPQNPEIDEVYVAQERRSTDFKALKL